MTVRITKNYTIGLTEAELAQLEAMLGAGDRGAFYMAYHAMTGSEEALLASKVSTFGESTGGVAYVANWLMQQDYRPGGDIPPDNNACR